MTRRLMVLFMKGWNQFNIMPGLAVTGAIRSSSRVNTYQVSDLESLQQ